MSETYNCGHPRTADNTYTRKRGGGRVQLSCKTCDKASMNKRSAAIAEINRELRNAA